STTHNTHIHSQTHKHTHTHTHTLTPHGHRRIRATELRWVGSLGASRTSRPELVCTQRALKPSHTHTHTHTHTPTHTHTNTPPPIYRSRGCVQPLGRLRGLNTLQAEPVLGDVSVYGPRILLACSVNTLACHTHTRRTQGEHK